LRPFFEEIRPDLEGRRLATPLEDDLRLPLIDYYVGRSVEVVATPEEGVEVLRGRERAGLFLLEKDLPSVEGRLAGLEVRAIRGEHGKTPIALLLNR
jgi:hypothetical protein